METKKLESAMTRKNLTPESLAKRVGMSAPGLRKALKEGSIKLETFEKFASAINVHPLYFFMPGADFAEYDSLKLTDLTPELRHDNLALLKENGKLKDKIINLNEKVITLLEKKLRK